MRCYDYAFRIEPKFFISAPFGNYIKSKKCISVTGTWTLNSRGNRLWAVIKTLRYNIDNKGWTNKLGLPNPGINVGLRKTSTTEVLSIAEVEREEFNHLNILIPPNQNIELNLSCPNIGKSLSWESVRIFDHDSRDWCIAKMSPLTSPEELEFVIEYLGFKQIHVSNTLPTKNGGQSGTILKDYTLGLIELIRDEWKDEVEIIAGGGVREFKDVLDYLKMGADHISIGSVCFNPLKLRKLLKSLT